MVKSRLLQQIHASAFTALISALHILATTAVLVLAGAAIESVFNGEARIELKVPITVAAILAALWYVVTFISTLADLRKEVRVREARSPSFTANAFVAGLYALSCVFSAVMIAGLHGEGDPLWLQLVPTAFLALAFYGWPRTIDCNDSAVTQRSLWGRKKTIPYLEIEAISVDHEGTTTVLGAGFTIEHTQYHVGAEAFRKTVSQRSGNAVY